jgi:hypothetical protein
VATKIVEILFCPIPAIQYLWVRKLYGIWGGAFWTCFSLGERALTLLEGVNDPKYSCGRRFQAPLIVAFEAVETACCAAVIWLTIITVANDISQQKNREASLFYFHCQPHK